MILLVFWGQNQPFVHKTRLDTWLLKSRAGGQGPYLRSPDHLGRSSEVKEIKSEKKLNVTDRPTDRRTDGQSGL